MLLHTINKFIIKLVEATKPITCVLKEAYMFMMLISNWCQVTLVTHLNQMVQLIEQLLARAMNLTKTKNSHHAF